ncbi:MAG: dephospho-CoA kinase [Pyrinomonadaceae bacterium]
MLKVGLTGSIAVGKTFVCTVFEELGCFILDADKTAREVVEPGSEGLRRIVLNFGEAVLTEYGELDRKKLGSVVFGDEPNRQLLNSLLHPLVIEEQDKWLKEKELTDPNGIAIIDAALMIESGSYKRLDKLIVVWCNADIQLQRLMLRDSLSLRDAQKRISSQLSQEEKKKYADFLIDTSGGFEETRRQTTGIKGKLELLIN